MHVFNPASTSYAGISICMQFCIHPVLHSAAPSSPSSNGGMTCCIRSSYSVSQYCAKDSAANIRRTFGHKYTPKFRPPKHVEISVLRVAYATFISQSVINFKSFGIVFGVLISNQSFVPHVYIRARLPLDFLTFRVPF